MDVPLTVLQDWAERAESAAISLNRGDPRGNATVTIGALAEEIKQRTEESS